jgi:hypothetical protein
LRGPVGSDPENVATVDAQRVLVFLHVASHIATFAVGNRTMRPSAVI